MSAVASGAGQVATIIGPALGGRFRLCGGAAFAYGQFESGLTAALFGAMPAAVLGGVGAIVVAVL